MMSIRPSSALEKLLGADARVQDMTSPTPAPAIEPTLVMNAYQEPQQPQPAPEQESLPIYADEHIEPAKIPRSERRMVKQSLEGEPRNPMTKKTMTIQDHMGDVQQVIDPQRSAIMMQLGVNTLLAMQQQGKQPVPIGDLVGINDGPERPNQFIESLQTMGKYSNKLNYLDMEMDKDTGQERVAQTHFNPQRNDWIGYVTGGQPVVFKKGGGSNAEQAFHSELSSTFFDGKDIRKAQKNGMFKQLATEGRQIRDSMLSPEATNRALQVMSHISSDGESISIPQEAAEVPYLQLPDMFVKKHLMNEEGKLSMDGLKKIELAVEAARYEDTKHDQPFKSSLNIERQADATKINDLFSKKWDSMKDHYVLPMQDAVKVDLAGSMKI